MTILEHIQQANDAVGIGIKQFRFARMDEFNAFQGSFTSGDYPCHVMEPFTTVGTWLNGRARLTVPINGWMLKKLNQDTVNWRSAEIESQHLEPMRALAKAFIKALLSSDDAEDVVDPEVDEVQFTIKPEYMLLSSQLFGVSYTVQLPVRERIC